MPIGTAKTGLIFLICTEVTFTLFWHVTRPPGLQGAAAPTYIYGLHLKVFYKGLADNNSGISAYKGAICQGFAVYYI